MVGHVIKVEQVVRMLAAPNRRGSKMPWETAPSAVFQTGIGVVLRQEIPAVLPPCDAVSIVVFGYFQEEGETLERTDGETGAQEGI